MSLILANIFLTLKNTISIMKKISFKMYFMQKIVYPQSVLTKYGNKK